MKKPASIQGEDLQSPAAAPWPSRLAADREKPVESLRLSHRARTRLKREGISNIGELIEMTEDELLLIEHLGKKSITEIREALARRHLRLGMREGFSPFWKTNGGAPQTREALAPALPGAESLPEAAPLPAGESLSAEQIEFLSRHASALEELGRRGRQSLALEGVSYVYELAGLKPPQLAKLRGFNRHGLIKLEEAFKERGWNLGRALSPEQVSEILEFMDRKTAKPPGLNSKAEKRLRISGLSAAPSARGQPAAGP